MRSSKTTMIIGGVAAAAVTLGVVAAQSHADTMGQSVLKGITVNQIDGKDCDGDCKLSIEAGKNFTIGGKLDGYVKGGGYATPKFTLERHDGIRWVKAFDTHATDFDKWSGTFVVQGFADKETGSANFRIMVKAGDFSAVAPLKGGSFGKWYKIGEINTIAQKPMNRIIQSTNFMIGGYSYSQGAQIKSGSKVEVSWPTKGCSKIRGAMGISNESKKRGASADVKAVMVSKDSKGVESSAELFKGVVKADHLTFSKDLPKDPSKLVVTTTDKAKKGGYLGFAAELFCSSKPTP